MPPGIGYPNIQGLFDPATAGISQAAEGALADPTQAATKLAQFGPPPPGLGAEGQPLNTNFGAMLQGVQAPQAPGVHHSGGVSGAQGVPAPGVGGSPLGLTTALGATPGTQVSPLPTLGALIAGGR